MSIPNRLPTPVPGSRLAAAFDVLQVRSGQTVSATVLGKLPDGTTQLQIGDQVVKAALPQDLPAGTVLQLAVKGGGATTHLTIVAQRLPDSAGATVPGGAEAARPVAATPLAARPQNVPLLPGQVIIRPEGEALVTLPLSVAPGAVTRPGPTGTLTTLEAIPTAGSLATPPATRVPVAVTQATGTLGPQVSIGSGQPQVATVAQPTNTASAAVAVPSGTAAAATPDIAVAQVGRAAVAVPAIGAGPAPAATSAQPVPAGSVGRAASEPQIPSAAATTGQAAGPVATASGTSVVQPAVPDNRAAATASDVPVTAEAGVARGRAMAQPSTAQTLSSPSPTPVLSTSGAAEAAQSSAVLRAVPVAGVLPATVSQGQSAGAAFQAGPGPAIAAPVPLVPTVSAATPAQLALSSMVPVALAQQDSIAGLFGNLSALVGRFHQLPEPVMHAAMQMLATRINMSGQRLQR